MDAVPAEANRTGSNPFIESGDSFAGLLQNAKAGRSPAPAFDGQTVNCTR